MVKLGRNYVLTIEKKDGTTLVVKPPFTVEFDVSKNILGSANFASFRIYNLSADNRNQIRFDQTDFGVFRRVTFQAGYGDNLSTVFDGNMTQAWSAREGVDFITYIQNLDGGFAFVNSDLSIPFREGTPYKTAIGVMMDSLKEFRIAKGAIGNYSGAMPRGNSYSGSAADVLGELSGGGFFVDNMKAHALLDNECLEGPILLIDSESGLLGTPILENTYLNFEMLFEPRLFMCQKVQLKTTTGDNASKNGITNPLSGTITDRPFNGVYRAVSIHHRGMISESVCGEAITSVGLAFGIGDLKEVPQR